MAAIVVLLILLSVALLAIIGLVSQLNDARTQARWLRMELEDNQKSRQEQWERHRQREDELLERLRPFRVSP